MIEVLYFIYGLEPSIWLNLPRDDHHFGQKQKILKRNQYQAFLCQCFFGGKRSPNGKSKNGCATCKHEMKNEKLKNS